MYITCNCNSNMQFNMKQFKYPCKYPPKKCAKMRSAKLEHAEQIALFALCQFHRNKKIENWFRVLELVVFEIRNYVKANCASVSVCLSQVIIELLEVRAMPWTSRRPCGRRQGLWPRPPPLMLPLLCIVPCCCTLREHADLRLERR